MKLSALKILLYSIYILLSATNIVLCQGKSFTIRGSVPKQSDIKVLRIFKYENVMEQDYIDEIEIKNGTFLFESTLLEVDSYLIENPINKQAFIFIWDNNIDIEIDSLNFYNSKVNNSPLTDSLNNFSSTIEKVVFANIRRIDSLLNNTTEKVKLDSLRKVKSTEMNEAMKNFKEFTVSYLKSHLDSFESLYILTKSKSIIVDEVYDNIFNSLSTKLKSHSRYMKNFNR